MGGAEGDGVGEGVLPFGVVDGDGCAGDDSSCGDAYKADVGVSGSAKCECLVADCVGCDGQVAGHVGDVCRDDEVARVSECLPEGCFCGFEGRVAVSGDQDDDGLPWFWCVGGRVG